MGKHFVVTATTTYMIEAGSFRSAIKAFKSKQSIPMETEHVIVCEENGEEQIIEEGPL
jgi:hypothetical protein